MRQPRILALCLAALAGLPLAAAPGPLKIGLMPAVDAAPFLLAERRGYFREAGVDVELLVFTNAGERQVALQAGAVDGSITDLVAFIYNVQGGFELRISSATDGSFPFLVRKGFTEREKVSVGMMEVSVSNYLADAWLGGRYRMDKVFITEIPARLEMIRQGRIDLACLPEPIASMGELSGLEKRVFENPDDFYPDILVFTAAAARDKLDAIRRFHAAFDRAALELRGNPDLARPLLVERLGLDPRVRDLMILPEYHPTRLPDAVYLAKVSSWVAGLQGSPVRLDWERYLLRLGAK